MVPVSNSSPHRPNRRFLTLFSDNEQEYRIETIYDLGAEDNWMSSKTVQDMGFVAKMADSSSKPLVDFNGKPLASVGTVRAKWLRDGRYEEVVFRIAESGPFQALFGYKLLLEKRLVTINDDYTDGGFVLVEDEMLSEAERNTMRENERNTRWRSETLRKYREYRQRMLDQGWEWNSQAQAYFRVVGGQAVWSQQR